MKTPPKTYYLASQCGQELANVRELSATAFQEISEDITALEAFDRDGRLFRLAEFNHRNLFG
ncbi:hypothetical protein HDF23_004037 [Mucilaginibacter lappiensis]|uniref:Uncharacterized protein n=1 Tax=Mucilaginibacter lappiensis TaxID=354630 RepID=A0ABR6PPZ2_9SPHI|nr:hypothetical protein [Mucilaginibacter lappiensis]MBB6111269.1 hypothetical protein [Mucilaginibacter lappiensis]